MSVSGSAFSANFISLNTGWAGQLGVREQCTEVRAANGGERDRRRQDFAPVHGKVPERHERDQDRRAIPEGWSVGSAPHIIHEIHTR